MLELITMSLLSDAYINACIKEKNEEKILDLKMKVFCYAIRRNMLYNQIVEMIQNGKLSLEDIDVDKEKSI